eukprot:scaffold128724_cov48-Phaeocystis_antarctica.AAC.1
MFSPSRPHEKAADEQLMCVMGTGSQKARTPSSLHASARTTSANSSRQTPPWKSGHLRTTAQAYWSRQVDCVSKPARCW